MRLIYKKTNDLDHFQIEIYGEHVERVIHNMNEIRSISKKGFISNDPFFDVFGILQ